MEVKGMVHALERARRHLAAYGFLVCIQPHRTRRPMIAVRARGRRQVICTLINPVFQPLIDSANGAIASFIAGGRASLIRTEHHQYRVRIANPSQLRLYLSGGIRPPRFPPGGRRRMLEAWGSREEGAWIEVTEHMTVVGLRAR
jgi:hypothetical protein